jgi:hypothetical protein
MKPKVLVYMPDSEEKSVQYFEYLLSLAQNYNLEIILGSKNRKFLEIFRNSFPVIHFLNSASDDFLDRFRFFAAKLDKFKFDYYVDLNEKPSATALAYLISSQRKLTTRNLGFFSKMVYSVTDVKHNETASPKNLVPFLNVEVQTNIVNDQYILIHLISTDELIKRFSLIENIADNLVTTGIVIVFDSLIPGDIETIADWYKSKKFNIKIAFESDNSLPKLLGLLQNTYIFIVQESWLYEFSKRYLKYQLLIKDLNADMDFGLYLEKVEGAQRAPSSPELL